MTTTIQTYTFNEFNLNVYGTIETPYFRVDEVCTSIGVVNNRRLYRRVPAKYRTTLGEVNQRGGPETATPLENNLQPHTVMLTESGLYYAICTSNHTRRCEAFRDWVFEKVIPSIRKTGSYSIDDLSEVHSKAVETNSDRINLTQHCEKLDDLVNHTTVGKVVDEIYPRGYKRGFKQYVGKLVKTQLTPVKQTVIDSFQSGHEKLEMKAYIYSDEFKERIGDIIKEAFGTDGRWILKKRNKKHNWDMDTV
jgi:prophage antirepressor-like protein